MRIIYKYVPSFTPPFLGLQLPVGAKLLHVDEQEPEIGVLTMWFEQDLLLESTALEDRTFVVHGTGIPFTEAEQLTHRATVLMRSGLVWHVYEEEA